MFSAARALLAIEGLDSSKHSGMVSLFNRHFVKNGIVDKDLGRLIMNAKDFREKGDYGDFVIVNRGEAEEQLEAAKKMISAITEIINKRYSQ